MKNLKTFLSVCLMLVFAISINAQVSIGARGGLTLSTFNTDPLPENFIGKQDIGYATGFDAAIFSNFKLMDNLSIQPEFHYVQKGVKITGTDATDNMDLKMTYRYDYLELPVLVRLDFMNQYENLLFYVSAGPSVGYGLSGKYKGENVSIEVNEGGVKKGEYEMDLEWDDEYGIDGTKSNRWDVGGTIGIGGEFLTEIFNLIVDARYNLDFTDAVKYETTLNPEPDKINNKGYSITIGIGIPIGGN